MSHVSSSIRRAIRRTRHAVLRFFTKPATGLPLAAFRIGIAAVLLVQGFSLAGDVDALYSDRALVPAELLDRDDATSSVHPLLPRLHDVRALLEPLGIHGTGTARVVFLTYLTSLSCLLIGWKTRLAAAIAWLTHLTLNNAATATIYGVDMFAHLSLFYCIVLPTGAALAVDAIDRPLSLTAFNRLGLRVLQLHLCIVYFTSAIEKAVGPQWWNGEAIWRAVTLPEMATIDLTWLATVPWLPMFVGWSTLAIEGGYAIFIWPKSTRTLTALATIGMHLGIAVVMGLVSFSALMIALTAAAFLVPALPRRAKVVARSRCQNNGPNMRNEFSASTRHVDRSCQASRSTARLSAASASN